MLVYVSSLNRLIFSTVTHARFSGSFIIAGTREQRDLEDCTGARHWTGVNFRSHENDCNKNDGDKINQYQKSNFLSNNKRTNVEAFASTGCSYGNFRPVDTLIFLIYITSVQKKTRPFLLFMEILKFSEFRI